MRDIRERCGVAQRVISFMGLDSAYKIGVFKEELKNRFRCVVTIDNEDTMCYIPSSSRLSNFIDLSNRVVMLRPIKKKNAKTQYSVYAVKYDQSFVLLDLSSVNSVVEKQLPRRLFSFLGSRARVKRECVIGDYKCDLYLEDSDTIIEIKSVLSFDKDAVLPTVYSERAIKQLTKIKQLLLDGHKVFYFIASLYQGVEQVRMNPNQPKFYELFMECIEAGMTVAAFSLKMSSGKVLVRNRIEVII